MDVLHLHLKVVRRRRSRVPGRPHVMWRRRPTGTHLSRVGHAVGPRRHPRPHHLTLSTRLTLGAIGMHHLTVWAPDWLLPVHRRVHVRRRTVSGLAWLLLHVRVRGRHRPAGVVGHPLLGVPRRRRMRVSPRHSRVHLLGIPGWHPRMLRRWVSRLAGVRRLPGTTGSHMGNWGPHVGTVLSRLRWQRLLLGHRRHCRRGDGRRRNSLRGGRFRSVCGGAY